jgi:transposase
MISSLTNQGKLRFMIYEGALKVPIFLDFLRRLVREAARKLFVIVDKLPVHRAHRVTAWLHDHADRIELFYLPSYAPEHNPDEFLNNDLKQAMARRRTPRDKAALKSSLTNRGKLRFMVYEGALKAAIFLNFLQRLIREATRKLFVIVDNLPVHRAHRVTAWVQDNADRIELFYLPSYAPEHNPDEFLNNDLKQAMARRRTPRDKAALKSSLTSYMRSLQRCPAKVRAFFQAPSVRYAA